jgi:hypothetical protein
VAYVGNQPSRGAWRKLTDISGSFNGVTTTFTTSVPPGTSEYYVTAGTASQLLISVGGVIQQPDVDYTVNTNSITFTTAPAAGLTFFGVLCGDALNTGTPADGSITTAKLAGGLSVGLTAGSASTAALYFTGDANTGLYSPGADQLAITTGGTGRLTIDASGNVNIDSNTLYVDAANNRVGLGTSSPSQQLSVATGSGNCYIQAKRALQSSGQVGINLNGGTGGIDWFLYQETSTDDFRLYANGNDRVTFKSDGKVGIGTTSPSTKLHVSDATQSIFRIEGSTGAGHLAANASSVYVTTESAIPFIFYTNQTERGRWDSSGRFLVGTSTARSWSGITSLLQLEGTSVNDGSFSLSTNTNDANGSFLSFIKSRGTSLNSNTVIQNDDILGAIYFNGTDGSSPIQGAVITARVDGTPGSNDLPSRLVFSTTADGASSPTERMRIGQAGYLKVSNNGTYVDAAATHHDLVNTASNHTQVQRNTNASPLGLRIDYTSDPNSTAAQFLYLAGGGTQRAEIRSNGGLANYSANNVNLSDRNVKKDISPAAGTWDCLKEWEIVNYRYKDQPDDADLNMGVIAQQVAESCPEVITVFQEAKEAKEAVLDEEGNELEPAQEAQPEKLGVKDQQMMWMAIKALQEAMERIEALEAKVAALKAL